MPLPVPHLTQSHLSPAVLALENTAEPYVILMHQSTTSAFILLKLSSVIKPTTVCVQWCFYVVMVMV